MSADQFDLLISELPDMEYLVTSPILGSKTTAKELKTRHRPLGEIARDIA